MDELPNELRDFLDLARDAHDPPNDQAQQRVRIALAAAIGVPAAGMVGTAKAAIASKAPAAIAAKAGWLAVGGKLSTLVIGTIAAAGIGAAVYATRAPAPLAAPIVQPVVHALPPAPVQQPEPQVQALPSTPEVTQLPAPEAEARKPRKAAPAVATDTLGEEMALLRAASEALAAGNEDAALVQLRTHAKRYPHGSLREERDGLRAIAECTRDQNPSAQAAARFGQQYPNSVLGTRVSAACQGR